MLVSDTIDLSDLLDDEGPSVAVSETTDPTSDPVLETAVDPLRGAAHPDALIDEELACLGVCFLDGEVAQDVLSRLDRVHFTHPVRRDLFDAINEAAAEGPADPLLVVDALRAQRPNAAQLIGALLEAVPTIANPNRSPAGNLSGPSSV